MYMGNKFPFRQRPERVAKRNYYYCYRDGEKKSFEAEHNLQKLEDLALPTLRQLRERHFALKDEDRLTFAGYIALAHTRVPTFERRINHLTELLSAKQVEFAASNTRFLESAAKEIRKTTGEEISAEEFQKRLTGGSVMVSQTNRGWSLRETFRTLLGLQTLIFRMHWTFLLTPPDVLPTIRSVLFDPVARRGIGFASSKEAHFTFPISRDVCLLAQHQRGPETVRLSSAEIRSVNSATIGQADGQLYAPFRSFAVQGILDRLASKNEESTDSKRSSSAAVKKQQALTTYKPRTD
jgi:hypothetical protein